MDAREDGVYITYVPSSGADPVVKKLGRIDGSQIVYPSPSFDRDSVSATTTITIPGAIKEAYILPLCGGNTNVRIGLSVSKGSAVPLKENPYTQHDYQPTTTIYYFENQTGQDSVCTIVATGSWPNCNAIYITI